MIDPLIHNPLRLLVWSVCALVVLMIFEMQDKLDALREPINPVGDDGHE